MDNNNQIITVEVKVAASMQKVWERWTDAHHITNWYFASDTWHTPKAENNLTVDGRFNFTMAAKDGSVGFDFIGTYTEIKQNEKICYVIADGRKVTILFSQDADIVTVTEQFEAENIHPVELQQAGWQSILNNFKLYVEAS